MAARGEVREYHSKPPPGKGSVSRNASVPNEFPLRETSSPTEGLLQSHGTTPQSPNGDSSPCTGEPKAPVSTDWRKICTHRNTPSVSRRVFAFPFGEGAELASADEGMQAAGTAQCDALLPSIPHQSLTRQLPPREAGERRKLLHPHKKEAVLPQGRTASFFASLYLIFPS